MNGPASLRAPRILGIARAVWTALIKSFAPIPVPPDPLPVRNPRPDSRPYAGDMPFNRHYDCRDTSGL